MPYRSQIVAVRARLGAGKCETTLSLPHPRRPVKLAATRLGAQFGGRALSLPRVANSTASLATKRLTGQRILRTNALEQLPG
ncbi:hypothetical protein ABIF73_003843 [Bradyrhizobium japonicum]